MTKTEIVLHRLKTAKHPEDVFGDDGDVKDNYRLYAKMLHPDTNPGDKSAEEGFKRLGELYQVAEAKLANGTYGDRTAIGKPIILKTKKSTYTITELIGQGDLAQVYGATITDPGGLLDGQKVAVKVVRSPANNDLLLNEANRLKFMKDESPMRHKPVMKHVPELVDSFVLSQDKVNKQIVILKRLEDYVTLADVLEAFPKGLPLADAAWMFNRLLAALLAVHQSNLVHGAVIPAHVLIHPPSHNGVLIDWSYCVKQGEVVKAISPKWKEYYPAEVFEKKPVSYGTDLYMAACVFTKLVGGELGDNKALPATIPRPIQGLMRACWLWPHHRTQDVFELFEDFKRALEDIFGKPTFRPFAMPLKAEPVTA